VKLDDIFSAAGAAGWGCCAYGDLTMGEEARAKAESLCPFPAGVFVAAFPYDAGPLPGNLSRYARGQDYHQVVTGRLEQVCAALRAIWPERRFVPGADNSPLPERECARLAGLGIQGNHGLVILPPYGSWIFLGTILTDLPLSSADTPSKSCLNCGACGAICPGGALRSSPFDESKCLSALTQKKGELTEEERRLVAAHPLIWGCDLCQQVCPYNREAKTSPLPEFRDRLICSLSPSDVEGLTNRQFRDAFAGRAFTWRGPGPLRRNLTLQENIPPFS
jgi:epoxyqueuosine reductase